MPLTHGQGWAPAIEDQAVDRVHRLGQTRATTIWRLVMEGTVEERVLDIQTEKRELVTKAFRERNNAGRKKTKETRLADINRLLGAGPVAAAASAEGDAEG
jgi:SWI/SNF-related matrix-associated actin-dependent regulator of chromatin subfamily A3